MTYAADDLVSTLEAENARLKSMLADETERANELEAAVKKLSDIRTYEVKESLKDHIKNKLSWMEVDAVVDAVKAKIKEALA